MSKQALQPRAVLFAIFAVIALFYSITSIEYFIGYDTKSIGLWERALTLMTSRDFTFGEGSVRVEVYEHYLSHRFALQLHATSGGICLFLGLFQFWTPFRQKYPSIHRKMGQLYVVLAIIVSLGSIYYLLNTPSDEVFSGEVFEVALYGLAILNLFATFMAIKTIRARQFEAHRAWMLQSYFCILSAPILRALWVAIYQVDSGMTHWDNNLFTVVPTTALVAVGPLFFFSLTSRSLQHGK